MFEDFIAYVRSLASLTEEKQRKPLGEGKWSVRDVIAHMWKWDEFFWEHAIQPLTQGKPLTYHHLDFNSFNENAKIACSSLDWQYLTEQAAAARERLVAAIRSVPPSEYDREYPDADGRPFSLAAYLLDFAEHDTHHRKQIDNVLGR
nr:DinB family protein [Cohnella sp. CFH 77786]